MEKIIISQMREGLHVTEISEYLKSNSMKPNSVSYIEKTLKKLRKENNATTNYQLAVILESKNNIPVAKETSIVWILNPDDIEGELKPLSLEVAKKYGYSISLNAFQSSFNNETINTAVHMIFIEKINN